MRNLILQNWLLFKNTLDQNGVFAFSVRITLFSWLNLIMIALILHPLPEQTELWPYLGSQYIYFLPMLSISAAIASFETELFAGTGEWLLLSAQAARTSRLLKIAAELFVPVLTFIALFIYTQRPWQDWACATLLIIVFVSLGLGIGFLWGFRSEKSINNFCTAMIWIFGFGPGPFMGLNVKWYQSLFPGAQILNGNFIAEFTKLGVYFLIALLLQHLSSNPRRYRFFAK